MLTRSDLEQREQEVFAPYAMLSSKTKGRCIKEQEPPYRTVYQRDRDRIVHSSAFRRLEYKTQVFVNHEGDYYRTRLTHSMEVAQISRSIARVLKLNEDLAESIALTHDVGHPPFGHAGEEILDQLMRTYGDKTGFEHNIQALRVVDVLEKSYPDFEGLNLTYEVREGIVKHNTVYDTPLIDSKAFSLDLAPTLEAQLVNLADEIAYDNHDLDDGIKASVLKIEDIYENVELWQEIQHMVEEKYKGLDQERKGLMVIRMLIDIQVKDLIQTSFENIKEKNIKTLDDVYQKGHDIICFSSEMNRKRTQLKKYLYDKMYRHYRIVRMCAKGKRFIQDIFEEYRCNHESLPMSTQRHIKQWGLERVICDYIASMTDRYALNEHRKLFDLYEKV